MSEEKPNEGSQPTEKRQYPRLNWNVQVQWQKQAGNPSPQASVSKDISQGGIRLILGDGVNPGDVLDLEITLSGGKVVRVKGKVAWVESFWISGSKDNMNYEGGIEFIDMSEEVRKELQLFMLGERPKLPKGPNK